MNKLVIETLKPLSIPVSFQYYDGEEETYITFFEYLEQGENWNDDEEKSTGHYIQVDIWSQTNISTIAKEVRKLMINVGFTRTSEANLYEKETETYHKAIRFFYLEEALNK